MFKIIALVTLLTGMPADVLVSNNTHPNCPNEEALNNTKTELQNEVNNKIGPNKYIITQVKCVPIDKLQEEARRFLTQRGS